MTPASGRSGSPIQFVDLGAQHQEMWPELQQVVSEIFETSAFVGGSHVAGFEQEFAAYLRAPDAVGVSSGTDAVRLALQLVDVGSGDAIVTVSHTFIGTVEGAVQLGVLPLFLDIDEESYTLSPNALRTFLESECRREAGALRHRRTGRRIGAIVPVHLYGQSADMQPILSLAHEHGVPVVEDAAQAQGASYRFPDGRVARCGTMGDAAAFSFYPSKNLGAAGEAGAVIPRDAEQGARARVLREHGQAEKYVHQVAGAGNYRLDALQAAVLRLKLRRLDAWNDARRAAARDYVRLLEGNGIEPPLELSHAHHVYHLYVVLTEERDRVRRALESEGIPTGIHYPRPLHLQPAFAGLDVVGGPLETTEHVAARCLSLPMHPHLDPQHTAAVAEALAQAADVQVNA